MNYSCEVCVVGAGVIGLSIAYELAKRNPRAACKVLLLDAKLPGAASWAGAGILPPPTRHNTSDPLEQLQRLSLQQLPAWSQELQQRSGIDNQYQRCGGYYLAGTAGEAAALAGLKGFWEDVGIDFESVAWPQFQQQEAWVADQLTVLENNLLDRNVLDRNSAAAKSWQEAKNKAANTGPASPALKRGSKFKIASVPGEAQLRNPRHLQALRSACERIGVQLVTLESDAGSVPLHLESDQRLVCGDDDFCFQQVVLAAGSWTSGLLKQWLGETRRQGSEVSVYPVKGEMLLFRAPRQMFRSVINWGTRYFVPRQDGHILVGSTEEEVGFDTHPTVAAKSELLAFVDAAMPGLREFPLVQHWVGFRPASFDQTPTIGRFRSMPTLIVASGHFRSGIQWSVGTAICVADLIEGQQPPIDLRVFAPGR